MKTNKRKIIWSRTLNNVTLTDIVNIFVVLKKIIE